MEKQVDKGHYFDDKYLNKERFLSYYYQIEPIIKLKPKNILEVGIGNGIVCNMLKQLNFNVVTVDIAKDLNPDKICSVTELSKCFKRDSFDLVLCAEVLEHIPFEYFETSLKEISKVTSKYAVISLPYPGISLGMNVKLPLIKNKSIRLKIPMNKEHEFNGEHYWEIGTKGYPLKRITEIIEKYFKIININKPSDDLYHVFFVGERRGLAK